MGYAAQSRLAAQQAPADEKPGTGEEAAVTETSAASSGQAEAPAEEQSHAAGGSEAKDAGVQQEESGAEQLQKQPSGASLEVSATVGMHEGVGCSHCGCVSLSAKHEWAASNCCLPRSAAAAAVQAAAEEGQVQLPCTVFNSPLTLPEPLLVKTFSWRCSSTC